MASDEGFFRGLVDSSATGIVALSAQGVIRFANPWANRHFGANLLGTHFAELFSSDHRDKCSAFLAELANRKADDAHSLFVGQATRQDGSAVSLEVRGTNRLADSSIAAVVLYLVDATAWVSREQELIAATHRDTLTGLPNRALFNDRLHQMSRSEGLGTVALADIDHFKMINDSFGHSVGDSILVEIGRRLSAAMADSITVARLGGDEFGLLFPAQGLSEARALLESVLAGIQGSVDIDGLTVQLPSISVGLSKLESRSAERAMTESDVAMYAAKARGRNQVLAFGDEIRKFAGTRRELAERVLALDEANAKLFREARTDTLTGLPNLRALLEAMEMATNDLSTTAILFIDVDHFGEFNHIYGDHPAGDEALKAIANAIAKVSRRSDFVFRKGGEEFVALLPDADLQIAIAAANRICSAVSDLRIAHVGADLGVVTVTVGVSCGGPERNFEQCLAEAGDLVMAAKREGQRNRVHTVK